MNMRSDPKLTYAEALKAAAQADAESFRKYHYGLRTPEEADPNLDHGHWGRRCDLVLMDALSDPIDPRRVLALTDALFGLTITWPEYVWELYQERDTLLAIHRLRVEMWQMPPAQVHASYHWLLAHDPKYQDAPKRHPTEEPEAEVPDELES